MELLRRRSSPIGRSWAEWMKPEGRTLNEMIARKTVASFGPQADFARLTPGQQEAVYAAIVESAGKSNKVVNIWMKRAGRAGRGLLVLSVAISFYTGLPRITRSRRLRTRARSLVRYRRRHRWWRPRRAGVRPRRTGVRDARRLRRRRARSDRNRLLLEVSPLFDRASCGTRQSAPIAAADLTDRVLCFVPDGQLNACSG